MTLLAVAYIFLCLGFCLGFAISTVLTMNRRAGSSGYQARRSSDAAINTPPRRP